MVTSRLRVWGLPSVLAGTIACVGCLQVLGYEPGKQQGTGGKGGGEVPASTSASTTASTGGMGSSSASNAASSSTGGADQCAMVDCDAGNNNPCALNACDAGICSHPLRAAGSVCDDGDGGGFCTGVGDCVQCLHSNDCADPAVDAGLSCSDAGACKLVGGRACSDDGECLSGVCRDKKCLRAVGGPCKNGAECASNLCPSVTSPAIQVCASCTSLSDCVAANLPPSCAAGMCRVSPGQTCAHDSDCYMSECVEGLCKIPNGKACLSISNIPDPDIGCASGFCNGMTCGACNGPSDCASSECNLGTCALGAGWACSSSAFWKCKSPKMCAGFPAVCP
jgi:hypothetical protein